MCRLPVIQIYASKTVIQKSIAPVIAEFSSRGPSSITPDFLKVRFTTIKYTQTHSGIQTKDSRHTYRVLK